MPNKRVVRKAVSMYPNHWNIVDQVNNQYQFNNTSAAMRYIINEYQRCQEAAASPPTPKQQENKPS